LAHRPVKRGCSGDEPKQGETNRDHLSGSLAWRAAARPPGRPRRAAIFEEMISVFSERILHSALANFLQNAERSASIALLTMWANTVCLPSISWCLI
jgi:hypothetical protein